MKDVVLCFLWRNFPNNTDNLEKCHFAIFAKSTKPLLETRPLEAAQ